MALIVTIVTTITTNSSNKCIEIPTGNIAETDIEYVMTRSPTNAIVFLTTFAIDIAVFRILVSDQLEFDETGSMSILTKQRNQE